MDASARARAGRGAACTVVRVAATRGLSVERQDEIFAAALEVVTELGFEQATVDAVAARCGASKATLYRHWPSKAALLVDAVEHTAPVRFAIPEHGSFRADVLSALRLLTSWVHANAALLLALVYAGYRDPELSAQTRRHLAGPKDALWETLARRWQGEPGIRPDADLSWLGRLGDGLLLQQLAPSAVAPSEDLLERFVDEVVLPLFAA